MRKATFIISTLTFTLGCLCLWLVLTLFEGIYKARFDFATEVPEFTQSLFRKRLWLLYIPCPFLVFTLMNFLRKPRIIDSIDAVVFYITVLVALFAILLFCVSLAVVIPWLPHT